MNGIPGLTGRKRRWHVVVTFHDQRPPVSFYAGTIADVDYWHLRSIDHDKIDQVIVKRRHSSIYNAESFPN